MCEIDLYKVYLGLRSRQSTGIAPNFTICWTYLMEYSTSGKKITISENNISAPKIHIVHHNISIFSIAPIFFFSIAVALSGQFFCFLFFLSWKIVSTIAIAIVGRMITIREAIQKRSNEPIYKTIAIFKKKYQCITKICLGV